MIFSLDDILVVLRDIEVKFSELYLGIAKDQQSGNNQLKTAAKILSGEELKHAEAYTKLINDVQVNKGLMIDESIFTSSLQVLNQFRDGIQSVDLNAITELIRFAVDYEKKNADLLRDIVVDMENKPMDIRVVELFQGLIQVEEKHSAVLSTFLKKEN